MIEELPSELVALMNRRVRGTAVHGNTPFDVPVVSHIVGNLWQGGFPGPVLPAYFDAVLNLYPWEPYRIGRTSYPGTIVRHHALYDSTDEMPDRADLAELAGWLNESCKNGPTLVHCQIGLNRSALVAGLALIRGGFTPDAAIALLREKRGPAVLCNWAFERYLRGVG